MIDKVVRSYNSLDALNSKVMDSYERSNVWEMNPKTRSKHPAPYPIELTDKIVQYYSFVGDTILDPFFGSGTTALSCVKYNRKCIGFEIHSKYIDLFTSRLKKIVSIKLIKTLEIDVKDYKELDKEEIIKKLMKNPKKMLFEIIIKKNKDIKKTISKKEIVNKLYELLFNQVL